MYTLKKCILIGEKQNFTSTKSMQSHSNWREHLHQGILASQRAELITRNHCLFYRISFLNFHIVSRAVQFVHGRKAYTYPGNLSRSMVSSEASQSAPVGPVRVMRPPLNAVAFPFFSYEL